MQYGAARSPLIDEKIDNLTLDQGKSSDLPECILHRRGVECPIHLRAWTLHCWSLASVEHAKLNSRLVCHSTDQSIERVDLPNQMALAKTANGRVARQRSQGREAMSDKSGAGTKTSGRRGRLRSGMAATDNDHIER